jgi:type III restriction enzyme
MPSFILKGYQAQALQALERTLLAAQTQGIAAAFQAETGHAYLLDPFGDERPCVCLRIPTGGGKTLLGAHAAGLLPRAWPNGAAQPLLLWLTPSDIIRTQTYQQLSAPGHPLHEALREQLGDLVRVLPLEELATLSPTDFAQRPVVVVATMQSFRVENTEQRNVYAPSEDWERHFRTLSAEQRELLRAVPDALVTAEDAAQPRAGRALLAGLVGKPRPSLANWLALQRPYVIVDEAHTAKTARSFEALLRLNPAALLELTATPVARQTNVLYSVSAQQLQVAEMVKLPIVLVEHPQGWQAAVLDAVQTRAHLEAEAQQDEAASGDYLRPIALLQAQNDDQPVNVGVLRAHLIDELRIPEAAVKVATGTQRELEGLNLAARDCPVRFIITKQALREGWDCPFAYVLCSVQSVRSATAVEQLLGRVLRMPYARNRGRPALNQAYAFVSEAETGASANALADRLVDGMGFEPLDLASLLVTQTALPGMSASAPAPAPPPALTLELPSELPPLPLFQAPEAQVHQQGDRRQLRWTGRVPEAVAATLTAAFKGKQRDQVAALIERHNALVVGREAPAARGERFPLVPMLCLRDQQGALFPLEKEDLLEQLDFDPLCVPVALPGFELKEEGRQWTLYLDDAKVRVGKAAPTQLPLAGMPAALSADDLAASLTRDLQRQGAEVVVSLVTARLRAFVTATLSHLIHGRGLPLAQLERHRQPLRQALVARLAGLRDQVLTTVFRQQVLDGVLPVETVTDHGFDLQVMGYPAAATRRYTGRFAFPKHMHAVIDDLRDGSEEFRCAMAIEHEPRIRRWLRNLAQAPGFSLPTSQYRFYPDFLCELEDGRVMAVEYKGESIRHMPRELEKAAVGALWAQRSHGRALFVMVYLEQDGLDMGAQIRRAIGG